MKKIQFFFKKIQFKEKNENLRTRFKQSTVEMFRI